ncbi:hypothetical protein [Haladaptatus sp. AB643]|uniref:hypothetical protein n=1 Tax=Haladaptatus sp. AB643 TaxID=2934174 RepID=UPI00209C03CA|nr:hypothetical protein [Haladaptatus sp. AB643]MCO8246943.1 hypothetical protein [Haladaptatus sp. AB643]
MGYVRFEYSQTEAVGARERGYERRARSRLGRVWCGGGYGCGLIDVCNCSHHHCNYWRDDLESPRPLAVAQRHLASA